MSVKAKNYVFNEKRWGARLSQDKGRQTARKCVDLNLVKTRYIVLTKISFWRSLPFE